MHLNPAPRLWIRYSSCKEGVPLIDARRARADRYLSVSVCDTNEVGTRSPYGSSIVPYSQWSVLYHDYDYILAPGRAGAYSQLPYHKCRMQCVVLQLHGTGPPRPTSDMWLMISPPWWGKLPWSRVDDWPHESDGVFGPQITSAEALPSPITDLDGLTCLMFWDCWW